CRGSSCFHGCPMGDAVQPASQCLPLADRTAVPRQHEKGCLEGVFRVLLVLKHPAAHAQNHRTVAGDQSSKGGFVAACDEVVKQLVIGPLPAVVVGSQPVKVSQKGTKVRRGHCRASPLSGSLLIVPGGAIIFPIP